MDSYIKKVPTNIVITSVLMGIYLNLACIAVYLFPSSAGQTDSGGFLGYLYIGVILSLLVMAIINRTFSIKRINPYVIIAVIGILIFYFYSLEFYPEPRTPFNHFIVFTIFGLLLPSISVIDTRKLLLSVIYTSLPAIFLTRTIFLSAAFSNTSDDILSQGYSYAFMAPVVCAIVYAKYFLKYDVGNIKLFNIIALIINSIFGLFLFLRGSRGPVAGILLLLVAPFIFKDNAQMHGILIKKFKLLLFVVLALLFLYNLVPILQIIQGLLADLGLSFHFIDKIVIRGAAEDITSGRLDIYEIAMAGFYDHPLFGNGFDQFLNNTGVGYPHNFFTQTLYDGGLVLFAITILPVFICFCNWIRRCTYEEFIIILTLFFASVPGALVSHDLWEMGSLWLFYGAVFNYKNLVLKVRSN